MTRRIAGAALILVVSAVYARAQITPIPGGTDSIAVRIRPDGGALSPVVLTYMATVQQGADTRPLGERSVQLTKSMYAGLSAWEIIETRGAGTSAAVDTMVVDYLSLAPFHWGAVQPMPGGVGGATAAARVSAEFRSDTMMGVMSSPAGRRTIVAGLPSGAWMTAAHFEVGLRGLPVAAGWRDSTWVIMTSLGKTTPVPAAISVVGEEKILTAAGSFECWVVNLTTDGGRTQYWVSKPDRIVVQSAQLVPETGALLQYQLSHISH